MSFIILNVDEVRRTLSASGGAFVVHDKEVDIVRFAINSGFADIVLDGQVALRVMYQRPGETEVRAQTLTYYDTDGLRNYYDWQLLSADLAKKGTLTVALCILRTDGEVEEWHTTPYQIRVLNTIHTDDSDEGDETITPTAGETAYTAKITVADGAVTTLDLTSYAGATPFRLSGGLYTQGTGSFVVKGATSILFGATAQPANDVHYPLLSADISFVDATDAAVNGTVILSGYATLERTSSPVEVT